MNHLENYYANYDEEGRLTSKHGQVEYRTTMKYIYDIIGDEKKKILEVGAGTGRYSVALAKESHEVDALEYTEHNLKIMNGNGKEINLLIVMIIVLNQQLLLMLKILLNLLIVEFMLDIIML
jgi:16S rRNA A1518/A1519 N6-dimethyltransferase RsmA/KsgA/DIM1 with predicted DNA glycosylase/AP lyase activity